MLSSIKLFFAKGAERTQQIKKNIIASFILKGGNIVISFILIPLTINYVNPTQYGIWITLGSIVNWFSFFDIGFGNGLRNKIAEANALNQPQDANRYISTTYAALTIISVIVFLVFFVANHFINWNLILNISPGILNNLQQIALIFFACFCVQFVTQIINIVLVAFHSPSRVSLISFFGQLISLIVIYILTLKTKGSLQNLVLVLAGVPLIVQFLASLWYYNTDYRDFLPRFRFINFKYAKEILKIGGLFFIIQIGALILYETDNIVITQVFGPRDVTVFNIAYKLFFVVVMVSTIIMNPFWSAFTEAFSKNNFEWIKTTIRKMYYYLAAACLMSLLLFLVSPVIYKIWVGKQIKVPVLLSFTMALQVIGHCWLIINCFFLNGIGKIRLQVYLYIICMIINIPLSIFLCRITGSTIGVTISNLLIFAYMNIVLYIQSKKIINKTATGIWNR